MTATLSNQHRLGHYSLRAFFAPRALATDPKARSVYSRRRPYQRLAAGYAAGSRTAGLLLCLCALLAIPSSATTVYLPAPGALTFLPVTGATNTTPIVITSNNHNLSNGAAVWCQNIGGNLAANGYFIISGATTDSFQLTHMYFGGNVPGNGSYTGAGTCTPLTAYTMTANPRVWLDGPSGTLYQSLSDTSTKANSNNPPWSAMNTVYGSSGTNFPSIYTTTNVDSGGGSVSIPWWFNRFATSCFLWNANRDATSAAVCDYGIDHIEQVLAQNDNFYCDTSGSQCANRNNSLDMDYGSFEFVPMYVAYSIYHSQLTSAEIQNFANKMLNDNDINHNGLGMPGTPTTACANSNAGVWAAGDCGFTFLLKHNSYSPVMIPGQEAYYTQDYGSATQAGLWDLPPHASNLTMAQLYGDIARAVALADDDPRAQLLLTQAYTYWYKWYWAYATSSWTGMSQLGARYSLYRGFPYDTEIAVIMKNSCGLDITGGNYLTRQLPYALFLTLPDNPNGQLDVWGDVYSSADNPQDAYTAIAAAGYEYQTNPYAPYAEYWINNTIGEYNAAWMGNSTQLNYVFRPFVFIDPSYTQTNYTGIPTQFLFNDTDYATCTTAFGSSGLGNCYANQVYGAAVSKSSWGTTATQVVMQASYNQDNMDHSGCGTFGSYHIYKQGYLLGGTGATDGFRYANGAAHADCGAGMASDNLIELGGADNWLTSAPATISRWASTDPTGDTLSRYAYLMADITASYSSAANATRVQRHFLHLKKPGTQDYVLSYDDVATSSPTQVQAMWGYYLNGNTGSNGVSSGILTVKNTSESTGLVSSFLPVTGHIAMVSNGTPGMGNIQQYYTCPSSSGASCNTSASSFEQIAVHLPTTSTSPTMPVISQPICAGTGGNCTVVDIQDTNYPKVAVFARQGVLLSGVAFASTHAGAAQYLIAGLAAGTYTVNYNGSAIAGSPFTVAGGDNTLYFESNSGSYNVAQSNGSGGSLPTVASFTGTPTTITAGQSSTLSWSVTGIPAPAVSINDGVGPVSGSSVNVSPSATTVYTLTAVNSVGSASAQVTVTVTPDTTQPSVPTNLTATAVSSSQIKLSWTASTDSLGVVAGYRIYRGGVQVGTASTTYYLDSGLAPATTYTYTVAAYDNAGNVSAQSAPASATTMGTGVQTPSISLFSTTPAAIVAGQSSTLAWSVSGIPAPTLSISNGPGSVTGQTSVSVSPGTTTTYTLTAANSAGSVSANATVTVSPDTTPPSAPANLTATAMSAAAIGLSWTASTDPVGVAGYRVYRNGVQVGTPATTSYTDAGLMPSTTYTYTVAAYDTAGNISAQSTPAAATTLLGAILGNCPVFPSSNVWNTPVNNLPVDANSAAYINTIGSTTPLHPDFSSTGGGIPYNIVAASQPLVSITFSNNSQGDPGPYPIPSNALVESGSDQHVLVLDEGNCMLYELYEASLNSDGVTWSADNGAVFNLRSNILRPAGWTSADAAGLPILPGLVKYDEVMSGHVNHALRMTAPQTLNDNVWPATHFASSLSGTQYPPMGQRFRLQASVDVTPYPFAVQVILNTLKTYGAFLADNGSAWYLTGAPDSRWNDSNLAAISEILGNSMEAVDESSLQAAADSASVAGAPLTVSGIYLDQRQVAAGATVNADAILTAPAPSGGADVSVASSDPAAVSAPATVTVPAGSVSVPVPITINSISQATPVVLSSSYSAVNASSPILLVNGTRGTSVPLLSALSVSSNAVTGGSYIIGTLTLTGAAPSGGTIVALSSSNKLAVLVPAEVVVPAGSTTVPFLMTTYVQIVNAKVSIGAKLNGESLGVGVTITTGSVPSLSGFNVSPATAVGGALLTGTVTLSAPAPSTGTVVALSSSNTSAATVPIGVTVPAGASSATFTVTTYSQSSTSEPVLGGALGGVTQQVTLTIQQ